MVNIMASAALLGVAMATPLTIGTCQNTEDCLSFTLRLHNLPVGSSQLKDEGYACLNGTCTYVVGPGSLCRQASDCSQFAFLDSAIKGNRTNLLPVGYDLNNIGSFMDGLCSPDYCTIASECAANYGPFFGVPPPSQKCCAGVGSGDPCVQAGSLVATCATGTSCFPSQNIESGGMVCMLSHPAESTQWIGIVLTLIAAAATNVGLNLQKFALRKRQEKVVKKKEKERLGLFYRISSLKLSVSNLYKNVSNGSMPRLSSRSSDQAMSVDQQPKGPVSDTITEERRAFGQATTSSVHTTRTHGDVSRPVSQLKSVTPSDKEQFQSKLGMASLIKNPRWWLGFIVFAIGTFTNFAALQFAAQSLIGPLGSFSLVCNVVVAPILNGEKWTWKDIVGVVLIVGGSAIVVVFSGSSSPDYNVCVLLKLFQQAETIVFLSITCGLILALFLYIVVVEKNIFFKEASAVVITEALEKGELVKVEARTLQEAHIVQPAVGVSLQMSDEVAPDGSQLRILTIQTPSNKSKSPELYQEDDDDDDSSDSDEIEEHPIPPPKTPVRVTAPNLVLVDGEGNDIKDLLNSKTADGDSITTIALTFKVPEAPKSTQLIHLDPDVESISSAENREPFHKETVLVLPNPKKLKHRKPWVNDLIDWMQGVPALSWILTLQLVPRLKEKIPLKSKLVRFGLPFSYASLGGLMATLLTLFAKATIYLLTTSFQGQNQFTSFPAYLFTAITLFCAISQIYWINLGLARYDALLQIPVFYVVWTLFDVI
ncbi:NIPA-like protein 3, partial [Kappamyces sp. JEL0680]